MKNQFVAISVLIGCCMSLRVIEDGSIPSVAEKGQELHLTCKYDLEGDSLYSLKWYKDNAEFYRYTPSDIPHVTVFLSPGIDVSDASQPTNIILRNVSRLTNGQFKCEVSGDAPRFQTDVRIGNLKTVELPASGPEIHGVRPKYSVGETMSAVCMSPPSSPVAQLKWYINNDAADTNQVKSIRRHLPTTRLKQHAAMSMRNQPGKPQPGREIAMNRQLLQLAEEQTKNQDTNQLQLTFKIQEKHFLVDKDGNEMDMRLKCTAQVLDLYWKSTEVSVEYAGMGSLPSYFWPHTGEASSGSVDKLVMWNLYLITIVFHK